HLLRKRQRDVVEADRLDADRGDDVGDPRARAGKVVDVRALGTGVARRDEGTGDVARELHLTGTAVRDRVRPSRRGGEHRGRGGGRDALVATDAVDRVRAQADARDDVLLEVDPCGVLVRALEGAVQRARRAGD